MWKALTRAVSPHLNRCELSFTERRRIDYGLAMEQHGDYCNMLRECGVDVIELKDNPELPDGTFIEDTAVVLDEIAVLANMGAPSRRKEVEAVEKALAPFRRIERIEPPATLEGGDVLRMGKRIFTGLTRRTNAEGAESLCRMLEPLGYEVIPASVSGCLHLKSACTAVDDHTLLANPEWVDLEPFAEYDILPVPPGEPHAANALRIGNTVCMHSGWRKTIDRLRAEGFRIRIVDIFELIKAEAGMTCSSILFQHSPASR